MKRAFWIWNIPNCEGGDPLLIAAAAANAGLSDVFVKVADGVVKFGVYDKVDVVPPVIAALRAVGIRVWGWQYAYGYNPAAEEKIATARIHEFDLDGFIVDAEVEFKKPGWGARAETYLKALRANNPGVEIAFSSFRFPHYHMEFPWEVFFKHCDVNMPQVYWLQATNAGAQTITCIERFRAMAPSMPLMLAGPAWKENGWRPTPAQIKEFEEVAESRGIPLVSYWSWEHCRRDLPELWPKIPVPAPDPEEGTRLARVEKKVQEIERILAGLSVCLADLKAVLR